MVFIIELMINQGWVGIDISEDGWMVIMCDGWLLVQVEYIVLVIVDGVEVLMLCSDEWDMLG